MALEFLSVFKRKKDKIVEEIQKELEEDQPQEVKLFIAEAFKKMEREKAQAFKDKWDKVFKEHMQPSVKYMIEKATKDHPIAGFAMDASDSSCENYAFNGIDPLSDVTYSWYAANNFRGYPWCAIVSQQWLISKICRMPAEDAIRNGFEIVLTDKEEGDVSEKLIPEMEEIDLRFKLKDNMLELIHMGRVFGIRVAYFVIESDDPKSYYENPFNIEGIKPGSYKGISQVDPYNLVPQLDMESSSNPASMHYLEPTWWSVGDLKIHRTHLIVYRTETVPDMIKPMYRYGGIPIPQKIAERVYYAEKIANEAVLLTSTKRTDVMKVNTKAYAANKQALFERLQDYIYNRDNSGIKLIDLVEEFQQFDTSLTDVVTTQNGQEQLCAAAGEVPFTELFGTSPTGFNSGDYELASYRKKLKSLMIGPLESLVQRHHDIVMKSIIEPSYGKVFKTKIKWAELDEMTSKELSEINKNKADTGQILMQSGAIQPEDERQRLINDADSGYSGIVNMNEDYEEINTDINEPGDSDRND